MRRTERYSSSLPRAGLVAALLVGGKPRSNQGWSRAASPLPSDRLLLHDVAVATTGTAAKNLDFFLVFPAAFSFRGII